MSDGVQRAMTRKVRAAFEFYAVTQDGASAGDSIRAFDNWLDSIRETARLEAAQTVRDYWDACGELIDTTNGARLAFEAVAERIENAPESTEGGRDAR